MSWISFEMLHLYAGSGTLADDIASGAARAKKWLTALQGVHEKDKFSKVVFVDDYSSSKHENPDRTKLNEDIVAAFEKEDVPPDFIVYESDVAESCDEFRKDSSPPPEEGEGSFGGRSTERYSNVDRSRIQSSRNQARPDPDERKDITMEVNLYHEMQGRDGKRVWTCPAVAAWWQLLRLGALKEYKNKPPGEGYVRQQNPKVPFAADRTFTLLPPSYLEVEHAVRLLLSNSGDLSLPIRKRVPPHKEYDNETWLNRVNYIFHD